MKSKNAELLTSEQTYDVWIRLLRQTKTIKKQYMKRFIYRIVLTATALFVVAGTMKAQLDLQNNLSGATVNWYISSGVPTADNPGTPATPGTTKVNVGQYVVVKVTDAGQTTVDIRPLPQRSL